MTDIATLFDSAYQRYQNGEPPETLISTFKEICTIAPKNPSAWTCLSWLYLLTNQPEKALKSAKTSVKLDPRVAQSRINLALALLETGSKGVREHIDIVKQVVRLDEETRNELIASIEDGFKRKPDWETLDRVQKWIFD